MLPQCDESGYINNSHKSNAAYDYSLVSKFHHQGVFHGYKKSKISKIVN